MEIYDVLIIGGGPAGVSAAIYARRKLLNIAIISKDIGGQVLLAGYIENFPGYENRTGSGLADIFERQLNEFGVKVLTDQVVKIEKKGDLFKVICEEVELQAKAVIATGGSTHKRLQVPGEDEFFGHGVSCCATCDAPIARNKIAVVVGGGNAAFQSVELLSRFATKVILIHRRDNFRADGILIERIKKLPNVELMPNTMIKEIKGTNKVENVILSNSLTGEECVLQCQKVFVEVGREIRLDYLKGLVKTNELGQVTVDKNQRTSCEGIFAAGDITDLIYGQAIIAAGDGAVAALAAYDFLAQKGLLSDVYR
ncbi:MAG: FAD-dependent oxidoreductase [Candidatus Methanomethylicus sp.]|nr:FAD-dependent oxidoreductase [Candidatus Methanomethylicus sp.]